MTTNKPEISVIYDLRSNKTDKMILLSDYEALQAECEELRRALSESQANDRQAMYYLNQVREIVGGDDFPDMVQRCRKLMNNSCN